MTRKEADRVARAIASYVMKREAAERAFARTRGDVAQVLTAQNHGKSIGRAFDALVDALVDVGNGDDEDVLTGVKRIDIHYV